MRHNEFSPGHYLGYSILDIQQSKSLSALESISDLRGAVC